MKIVYFDLTKFFVRKSFYENGDFRIRKIMFSNFKKLGRKNGYME